ncbi:hypothetical protein D3C86_1867550 [compost metagenome]
MNGGEGEWGNRGKGGRGGKEEGEEGEFGEGKGLTNSKIREWRNGGMSSGTGLLAILLPLSSILPIS